MSDDMQRILITQAEPGMVLAKSVSLPGQANLCGPGTPLTEALIHRLTIRGIKRIFVQGHPIPGRGDLPVEERLEQLKERFDRVRGNPVMDAVERSLAHEMSERV